MSLENIARFVRERRRARGLSQHELADLAGVGQRFVSELERAKPTLRVSSIEQVLSVFGKELVLGDKARPDVHP